MNRITWLHFSDVHYYEKRYGWDANRIFDAFIADLQSLHAEHQLIPDLVFFTGDAVYGHMGDAPGDRIDDQFDGMETFLQRIRDCYAPPIPKDRIYLVPGNHDVNRNKTGTALWAWLAQLYQKGDAGKLELQDCMASGDINWHYFLPRLQDYADFLKRHGYTQCLRDPKRLIYAESHTIQGCKIGIAGLNSAWSAGRVEERKGDIWLGAKYQIQSLSNQISSCAVRIALVHHPIHWFNQIEHNEIDKLSQNSFHFLLHGHDHEQWVTVLSNGHVRIAAGACYDRSRDCSCYNLASIDIRSRTAKIWLREFEPGTSRWRPMILPGKTDDLGRVVLTSDNAPELFAAGAPTKKRIPQKPTRAKSKRRKNATDDHQPRLIAGAVVIYADFVDFSMLDPGRQSALFRNLMDVVDNHGLQKSKSFKTIRSWRSDGSVVLVYLPQKKTVRASDVLHFCESIIDAFPSDPPFFGVRIGIHVGAISLGKSGSQTLPMGTTINECIRIANIGDACHIVCSEPFVRQHCAVDEQVDRSRFVPSLSEAATDVHRGRTELSPIRVYRVQATRTSPRKLALLFALSDKLDALLKQIEERFRHDLASLAPRLNDPEVLQARVSILERRFIDGCNLLCSTRHRFQNGGELRLDPGRARYSLLGNGIGSPGRAFVSNTVQARNTLADWNIAAQRAAYYDQLAGDGLDPETIDRWQRKSRTFVCFPFILFGFDVLNEPAGCICIDARDPTPEVSVDQLQAVGVGLAGEMSERLGALWTIRTWI